MNLDMMLGLHEPNTFEVARQIITDGMLVWDVGANRGYFTVFFSRLAGKAGRVCAFEPIPATFQALERACSRNHCLNVTLIAKAAAKNNGPVTMFLSASHYMSSLDANWAGRESGAITVDGISLDSFVERAERGPDFVKMDIEGGAVYALPGMEAIIKRYKPCLLLESHSPEEDHAIGRALSIAEYTVFRVGDKTPVKDLTKDYTDLYGIYSTVLGIPSARADILQHLKPERFQQYRFGQRKSRE